jgi:hypothetical protein
MEEEEYKSRDRPQGGKASSVIPGVRSSSPAEGVVLTTDSESESEVAQRNR